MTGNSGRGKLLADESETMYSPQLLDHFEHPRNSGDLPDADAQVRVENPACGDILELAIKMNAGQIEEIRFRAKGCVPAMACGSAMTELVKGKSRQAANAISRAEVVRAVGGVPPASEHAAQLAIDALRAALQKLR
ncbi:MAG: iron-sulfur cluster assembly scaffold protein [Candidatus Korobacteraceae bacterium]